MYNKHKMDLKLFLDNYKSSNSYSEQADKRITRIGLLLPFSMTFYGLLIQFGIIKSTNNYVNFLGFSIIMGFWILIGVAQTIKPGNTPFSSALRLSEFYIMTGLFLLLIAGVNNPFIFCWPILLLASYNYFELNGVKVGALALSTIFFIDILFINSHDSKIIVADLMVLLASLLTAITIIAVIRTHETRKAKLYDNIIKKSLQSNQVATIVNNLTDVVFSLDPKGLVEVYNAASLALLDTNVDLRKKSISKLLPMTDKDEKAIDIFSELKKSKSVVQRDDLFYRYEDGEVIRLEAIYTPVRAGYNTQKRTEILDGYVLILRDITKPKNIEEERDEFISVVSHELRTPITTTEGTISNIQAMIGHPNATKDMLKDSIEIAYEQIMFLSTIVNDLGLLSRAERGVGNEKEEVIIKELVNTVISRFSDTAKRKKIKLSVSIDKEITQLYTSPIYLEGLLQKIVNNGVKYTKKGSVELSVSQKGKLVMFSVKDTGIGISKTDQSKIFEKFYRSEDYRTRETGGTGLGLYVASKLAQQINTKINFESQLDKGSTFYFSIPNVTKNPNVKKGSDKE